MVLRLISVSAGDFGKTFVTAGLVLPSNVTGLVIQKPAKFNFSPGDWVFVKIPEIAFFEWHPFTISSAPEQKVSVKNVLNCIFPLNITYKATYFLLIFKKVIVVHVNSLWTTIFN